MFGVATPLSPLALGTAAQSGSWVCVWGGGGNGGREKGKTVPKASFNFSLEFASVSSQHSGSHWLYIAISQENFKTSNAESHLQKF